MTLPNQLVQYVQPRLITHPSCPPETRFRLNIIALQYSIVQKRIFTVQYRIEQSSQYSTVNIVQYMQCSKHLISPVPAILANRPNQTIPAFTAAVHLKQDLDLISQHYSTV